MSASFKVVGDKVVEAPDAALKRATEAQQQAARYLVTALQVVSQRFVTALCAAWEAAVLFAVAASVWWLWRDILTDPNAYKLTGGTIYALFAVGVLWMRRAK